MKEIKFIRFGGLSPQKQTHRKERLKEKEVYFHTPPRKKGIFAFPYPYVDYFLLGATYHPNNPSGKSAWLRDEKGNKVIDKTDYKYIGDKEIKIIPSDIRRIMKKNGIKSSQLWSVTIDPFMDEVNCKDDCDVCPHEKECESRQVTRYLAYLKKPRIFNHKGELWCHYEEVAKPHEIIETFGSWIKVDYGTYLSLFERQKKADMREINRYGLDVNNRDPYKKPGLTVCKDHLEVFIEKIK